MAAPTNVRVEANSIATATLRWDYAGANLVYVYRSTDGVSYTRVSGAEEVAVGTTSYTDTDLSIGTRYWYKLSEDAGSTFSSVVTVYTHSCLSPVGGGNQPVTLPRFDSAETKSLFGDTSQVPGFTDLNNQETLDRMNEMARRIEAAFAGQEVAPDLCIACPVDGAVVVDCSSGCINWSIVADEDINSVSIQWCGNFEGNIDFVVPPGATVGICGLPAGFGFSGDECIQAPISGGTNGRTVSLRYGNGGAVLGGSTASKPRVDKGIGKGSVNLGGSSAAGCACVALNGALTIKSCNANNSLKCSSTKTLALIACGGRGPYTWSLSGSVRFRGVTDAGHPDGLHTAAEGGSVTVVPPANTGSAVLGDAYAVAKWHRCNGGVNQTHRIAYGCNDQITDSAASTVSNGAFLLAAPDCRAFITAAAFAIPIVDHSNPACSPTCDGCPTPALDFAGGNICDMRSAPMIASGCTPCGISANGSIITVTDSLGTTVNIVLKA